MHLSEMPGFIFVIDQDQNATDVLDRIRIHLTNKNLVVVNYERSQGSFKEGLKSFRERYTFHRTMISSQIPQPIFRNHYSAAPCFCLATEMIMSHCRRHSSSPEPPRCNKILTVNSYRHLKNSVKSQHQKSAP
jgi:hypothetical protein